MRKHRFREHSKGLFLYLITFSCVLIILLFVTLDLRLRPMMYGISQNESKRHALIIINSAVSEVLTNHSDEFDSIVKLSTDTDGAPTALVTNALAVDNLVSEIFIKVHQIAENKGKVRYSLNVGSLTKSPLLYGRGPKININIQISQYINYEIISTFNEAGINQTKSSLYLRLTTTILSVMPGDTRKETVSNDYLFAETVLVGKVPDGYTEVIQVGSSEFDTADTLVNFGQ